MSDVRPKRTRWLGDDERSGWCFGTDELNKNAELRLEVGAQNKSAVCITFFDKRETHKRTWLRSLGRQTVVTWLLEYTCV